MLPFTLGSIIVVYGFIKGWAILNCTEKLRLNNEK
jgi:hypothetical protein